MGPATFSLCGNFEDVMNVPKTVDRLRPGPSQSKSILNNVLQSSEGQTMGILVSYLIFML